MGCEGKEACAVRQPRAAASETRRVRGDAAVERVLLLEVLLLERLPRRLVAVELGRTRAGGGGRAVRWACGFRRERRRRRGVTSHLERAERRAPLGELAVPVGEGRLRDDDQVGARDAAALLQVAEQRDRLQRLPEPHLVGEDAVDPVLVQLDQPVEALELVRPHRAVLDAARLRSEPRPRPRRRRVRARALLLLRRLHHQLVLLPLGRPPFFRRPAAAVAAAAAAALAAGRLDEVGEDVGLPHQVRQPVLRALLPPALSSAFAVKRTPRARACARAAARARSSRPPPDSPPPPPRAAARRWARHRATAACARDAVRWRC